MGLDRGADGGFTGPPVSGAPRHLIGARPGGDGAALRKCKGELGFLALAMFSGHGTIWHAVADTTAAPFHPTRGSQLGASSWPARTRGARKCWGQPLTGSASERTEGGEFQARSGQRHLCCVRCKKGVKRAPRRPPASQRPTLRGGTRSGLGTQVLFAARRHRRREWIK